MPAAAGRADHRPPLQGGVHCDAQWCNHVRPQALEDRRQVQQFLDAAQALVGQQPESVEAIGRARADAKRLVGQLPDILALRYD